MRIKAINEIDEVASTLTSIILADVPDKPATPPTKVAAQTNKQQIKVTFTVPPSDGGSSIRSYEL